MASDLLKPRRLLTDATDPPRWRAAAVERIVAEQRSETALLQSVETDGEQGVCAHASGVWPHAISSGEGLPLAASTTSVPSCCCKDSRRQLIWEMHSNIALTAHTHLL